MTLPTLLVIGTAKAGTTSLHHYLGQHPDVYTSPQKETGFFAYEGARPGCFGPGDEADLGGAVTEIAAYEELFAPGAGAAVRAEASTIYLAVPEAPGRIRARIPDVKLVAVLRDPAERAFSAFLHLVRDGRETTRDFRAALAEEEQRVAADWAYLWRYRTMGFYAPQVRRYLDTFERSQLRIFLYEDLRADLPGVLREIFAFIGVDPGFEPDTSERHNQSLVVKSEGMHEFLTRPNRLRRAVGRLLPLAVRRRVAETLYRRNFHRPVLDPALRRELVRDFHDDILELQDLIGRDLSAWLRA